MNYKHKDMQCGLFDHNHIKPMIHGIDVWPSNHASQVSVLRVPMIIAIALSLFGGWMLGINKINYNFDSMANTDQLLLKESAISFLI